MRGKGNNLFGILCTHIVSSSKTSVSNSLNNMESV